MSLTKDEHSVEIAGHTITVRGATGPVQARWTLWIDDREVDGAKASGEFTLRSELPDRSPVDATVFQSMVGPTRVTIRHRGEEVGSFKGYVA
jgi:hypothetical protein